MSIFLLVMLNKRQNGEDRNDPLNNDQDLPLLFGDVFATISDAKFSPCGRYVLARDFHSLQLWDTHKLNKPIVNISIPPDASTRKQVQNKLLDWYGTEAIFEDKFECGFDGTSRFAHMTFLVIIL